MLKAVTEQQQREPTMPTQIGQANVENPEQRNAQEDEDQQMLMELMRIRAQEKQKKIIHLWKMSDKELESFFVNYQFYDGLEIDLKELMKTKNIKLVKNQSRFYFGEVDNHKKHGLGVAIYQDGKIYEGCFVDNEKQGLGYQIYPNGNLYVGQFQKNKKHGLGSFYWFTISGTIPNPNELTQYYQGQWWGGLPSGKGLHRRANGDLYEGDFKNGLKHGQGFEMFSNGDCYKGDYVNGLPEGHGEYVWQDGSNYVGDFKQGVRNGFGIWKKTNQQGCQSYRGYYLLDRKSGEGIYLWENGEYYKGNFFQDMRQGYGQLHARDEIIYKGMWLDGEQMPEMEITKSKSKSRKKTSNNKSNVSIVELTEGDISHSQVKNTSESKKRREESTGVKRRSIDRNEPLNNMLVQTNKRGLNVNNKILISDFTQTNNNKIDSARKGREIVKQPRISNEKYNRLASNQKSHSHGRRIGHQNCIPVIQYGKPLKKPFNNR